jgi:hypothetical protein
MSRVAEFEPESLLWGLWYSPWHFTPSPVGWRCDRYRHGYFGYCYTNSSQIILQKVNNHSQDTSLRRKTITELSLFLYFLFLYFIYHMLHSMWNVTDRGGWQPPAANRNDMKKGLPGTKNSNKKLLTPVLLKHYYEYKSPVYHWRKSKPS